MQIAFHQGDIVTTLIQCANGETITFETGYNSAKILFQRILYPGDERVIQRGEWICFPGGRARIL
ncbi:MAG: hypothetical protein ACLUUO_08535 [Sellimonas intestinalis]